MDNIVHVSQFAPDTHEGGVAQFAGDLKGAFPEIRYLAHGKGAKSPEEVNAWYLEKGLIEPEDVVIADGFYGLGLAGKVERLIVVCHGTYAGYIRDSLAVLQGRAPLDWLLEAERRQARAYAEADALVAVSQRAAQELQDFYGLSSTVILNGVDPDVFTPQEVESGTIVEAAGNSVFKGALILDGLYQHAGLSARNLGFAGDKPSRWGRAEVALFPSVHEGGAYAVLEAMAMNKRIVAYPTGMLGAEIPGDYFWWTYDYYWRTFHDLILLALASPTLCPGADQTPREWVLEHATLEMFQANWRAFVEGA